MTKKNLTMTDATWQTLDKIVSLSGSMGM